MLKLNSRYNLIDGMQINLYVGYVGLVSRFYNCKEDILTIKENLENFINNSKLGDFINNSEGDIELIELDKLTRSV